MVKEKLHVRVQKGQRLLWLKLAKKLCLEFNGIVVRTGRVHWTTPIQQLITDQPMGPEPETCSSSKKKKKSYLYEIYKKKQLRNSRVILSHHVT